MTISLANDGFENLTGYTREEVEGKRKWTEFVEKGDLEKMNTHHKLRRADPEYPTKSYEFRLVHRDGDQKNIIVTVDIIPGTKKSVVSLMDITERKRAEEALKESENKYRLLADNIHDVVFVMDMNLNYTYISPSVKLLRGYEPEEAMKHTPAETLTPSSMDLALMTLSEIMEMEKSEHRDINISQTLQLEMSRKGGTTVWVETKASFIRDENQRAVGIMGLTRDITERKKAEEALKNSEAKYRNIFENAIEGIYQSTTEGRFITANAALARMAGYDSPEELIESIKDIGTQLYVYPEDRKRFLEIRDAKGFVYGFEVEFYKKDRSKFWVVINALTVKDEQGRILHFEGLIEDITIRKQAEEQLHQTLDKLKKAVGTTIQVLGTASEVRDPYTAGHQKKVADLACTIATEMGLAQEKIEGIRMAGSIHDIGKLSIPSEILSKPTKLTNIQFSIIKEHSQIGYEMLKEVESPWPLAEIVYQHHERMNGSGYPRNLKGDDILIEARIIAVADVVEAMASHRPYRAALGIDAALEEIEKNRGILYDNAVADTCLRLFREKGYQLS
jgi:PAS domain S-box-containing protein/putative nucleotidyltransferase with HDIG domain